VTFRGLSPREQRILRDLEAQFTARAAGRYPPVAPLSPTEPYPRVGPFSPAERRSVPGWPSRRVLAVALVAQAVTAFVLLLVFTHRDATWALYAFCSTWSSTLITCVLLWRRRQEEERDPRPSYPREPGR
jgi:hypothetical protein